jgi:hypothetical protein
MSTLSDLMMKRIAATTALAKVDAEILAVRESLHKGIEVVKRQASVVVFDKETGVGVVSCEKNSYGEYKVYTWDGKKGKLVMEGFRGNAYALRDWFVYENYKNSAVEA